MGRGYSNSRSKSARPTLRMKRRRSMSLQQLKESIQSASAAKGVRVKEQTRGLAADAGHRTNADTAHSTPRRTVTQQQQQQQQQQQRVGRLQVRSASTIRQKLVQMEGELEDDIEPTERLAETIAKSDVMSKYKLSGKALDEVMDLVASACVPGANTRQLCDLGDAELLQRVQGMFSKAKDVDGKRIPRGLSYPTNVSVNQTLCNHAPLADEDAVVLRGGDVVKIHMGCHIDGYPVSAARTILVPLDATISASYEPMGSTAVNAPMRPLTQGVSNAIEAARVALQGVIHLLQPGALNADITDFIHSVGNHFGVQAVEGVLSNRTKRWVPDGIDCIITRRVTLEDPHQDVADCTVGANQVWTLDVAFTDHSSYKVVPAENAATTIFRRTEVDFQNDARVRSVHTSLQEITEKHQCFPFSLKHLQNPLKARMAIAVLRKQNVIDPLPVLSVKGERHITARFSATVAVSGRRVSVLCGLPPEGPIAVPDDVQPPPVSDHIAAVLSEPLVFPQGERPSKKPREEQDAA